MQGMDIVKKIEQVESSDGKPAQVVKIVDCGEVSDKKKHGAVLKEKGNTIMLGILMVNMT